MYLCCDCVYCKVMYLNDDPYDDRRGYFCRTGEMDFVTGVQARVRCKEKNTDGHCQDFVQKPPKPPKVPWKLRLFSWAIKKE